MSNSTLNIAKKINWFSLHYVLILTKHRHLMRFLIFIIILFFPFLASAQENETVSAQLNITAEVSQSIELITVNQLTLENSQPGQIIITINPINDLNSGHMVAIGAPEAEFRLYYELEKRLDRIDGPGYLTFRYELSGNTIDDQSSSDIIQYENRNLRFSNEGTFYIWLGGELNLENALPGNYKGDFTIEIDYI